MSHSTLFVSPKRGGIMQSSGFLDLKSLMALNRTCKANGIDELSLIQLIEHEITRFHGVKTMEDAVNFWIEVCRLDPLLKRWLERDPSIAAERPIKVTRDMLTDAVWYEVMLAKMLKTVPTQSERLQLAMEHYGTNGSVLNDAAESGNHESLKIILSLFPNETERLRAVRKQEESEFTVLHLAATSKDIECIKTILSLYPESERLHAVNIRDVFGRTVLHCAARSGNPESIKLILSLYAEREHLRVVKENRYFGTALHAAAQSGNFESIEAILALYPESERLQALSAIDPLSGKTVLGHVASSNNIECIKAVLSLYPESERTQALNVEDKSGNTTLDRMPLLIQDSVMRWLSKLSEMQNE